MPVRRREAARDGRGHARYDWGVTAAQMLQRAVVETDAPSAANLRRVWESLEA